MKCLIYKLDYRVFIKGLSQSLHDGAEADEFIEALAIEKRAPGHLSGKLVCGSDYCAMIKRNVLLERI